MSRLCHNKFLTNVGQYDIFTTMKSPSDTPEHTTSRHPIAVVAERTGLSQDLLRVWERRYQAVQPRRGPGGHRTYSDADIERLRLLNAVTNAGRSISHVAGLSTDELSRMAQEDAAARRDQPSIDPSRAARSHHQGVHPRAAEVVDRALAATARLDAAELEHLLWRAVAEFGVIAFIEGVASPMLRRIGDDWHAGRVSIAHEHLASSIVYDLVTESMRSLTRRSGPDAVLVATPTGEHHAIGAALVGAAAAAEGWRVVYLGADVPAKEIAAAAAIASDVRVVAISLTYLREREKMVNELRDLRALLPAAVVLVAGGTGTGGIETELSAAGIRVGTDLADLRDALRAAARPNAA
jgi:MerR family transcriptional regulator, light-induced transcriptional regulator